MMMHEFYRRERVRFTNLALIKYQSAEAPKEFVVTSGRAEKKYMDFGINRVHPSVSVSGK
jgi:hypothetical protein